MVGSVGRAGQLSNLVPMPGPAGTWGANTDSPQLRRNAPKGPKCGVRHDFLAQPTSRALLTPLARPRGF